MGILTWTAAAVHITCKKWDDGVIDSIAKNKDEKEDICSESGVKNRWVYSCIDMLMCSSVCMGV